MCYHVLISPHLVIDLIFKIALSSFYRGGHGDQGPGFHTEEQPRDLNFNPCGPGPSRPRQTGGSPAASGSLRPPVPPLCPQLGRGVWSAPARREGHGDQEGAGTGPPGPRVCGESPSLRGGREGAGQCRMAVPETHLLWAHCVPGTQSLHTQCSPSTDQTGARPPARAGECSPLPHPEGPGGSLRGVGGGGSRLSFGRDPGARPAGLTRTRRRVWHRVRNKYILNNKPNGA